MPEPLHRIPDRFKTQNMCEKAVEKGPYMLRFVPDWFVRQHQVKLWHDDNDYCDNGRLVKWYDGYKKRKAQKAKIEEELMPIAWHPDFVMDWCVPEDEKKLWK